MSSQYCYSFLCFTPLNETNPELFGFSEFLAGLALMVLAWTIADIRYRFRISTAPLPLRGITFSIVTIIGILTLLTDLWLAQRWLVPRGNVLSPAIWQAMLGGLFIATFLTWAWFAFIRPSNYGRMNAKRFINSLYRLVLKGSPTELAVIADELTYSASSLVEHAKDRGEIKNFKRDGDKDSEPLKPLPLVTSYANEILLLIADRRFCRVIVESSPGTALHLFHEIAATKKYGIQIEVFARNIVNEALNNRDSFLFHEAEGYESGLMGYHKPLSQAIFSNFRMVETIGTVLDIDLSEKELSSAQLKAYCRAVLMTFDDYVQNYLFEHSYVLYRAKSYIEDSVSDLYQLNGLVEDSWKDDKRKKLDVVIKFIQDAVAILNKAPKPHLRLRIRDKSNQSFYDYLSSMIFEIIFSASNVQSPASLCWWIQNNSVWMELSNFNKLNCDAGKAIKFKVRRLIYDEIRNMEARPNFKGAKILGFCLNVMGLSLKEQGHARDSKALQKVVLAWTKKNYARLHAQHPQVAEACLVDSITYDPDRLMLIKTFPAIGLQREPQYAYLKIDPVP